MMRLLPASVLLACVLAGCGSGSSTTTRTSAQLSSSTLTTLAAPTVVDLSSAPSCIGALPFVSGVSGVYSGSESITDPVISDDQLARLEQPNTGFTGAVHAVFNVSAGSGVLSFLVFDSPGDAQTQGNINQGLLGQPTSKGNVQTVLAQTVVVENVLLNVYPNFSSQFQAELSPNQQEAVAGCLTGQTTTATASTPSTPSTTTAASSTRSSATSQIRCTNAAIAGGSCGITAESAYARGASFIPGDHNPNDANSAPCQGMEIGPHAHCSAAQQVLQDLASSRWNAPGSDTVPEGGRSITFNCTVVGREPTGSEAPIYSCISSGDPQDWFKFSFT